MPDLIKILPFFRVNTTKLQPVYLVEDNPILRQSLTEALEELAQARVVAYADNEADAINWLAVYSHTVEVVIIDIHLPAGSGYSILQQMRAAGFTHPIVVLTNNTSGEIRRLCMAAGATAFFDKTNEQELFFRFIQAGFTA